jgi:signal transduction histidine kinase
MIPLRIFLPVVLTLVLFSATLFVFVLPQMEHQLIARKRETIRELTETALSSLRAFERMVSERRLSMKEAQQAALTHLRQWRYGPEGKDYFWINDMHPRLVMHPYRPDLEGLDISDYADPTGKRIFVAFVDTVRESGAGSSPSSTPCGRAAPVTSITSGSTRTTPIGSFPRFPT